MDTAENLGTPEGYVVFTDRDGNESLLFDPELREAMRSECRICNGDDDDDEAG